MATLTDLRKSYHSEIGRQIVRFTERGGRAYPNFADLDCVYHFALDELRHVCDTLPGCEDQVEMLATMVQGNRLRDISDLPFDLAV